MTGKPEHSPTPKNYSEIYPSVDCDNLPGSSAAPAFVTAAPGNQPCNPLDSDINNNSNNNNSSGLPEPATSLSTSAIQINDVHFDDNSNNETQYSSTFASTLFGNSVSHSSSSRLPNCTLNLHLNVNLSDTSNNHNNSNTSAINFGVESGKSTASFGFNITNPGGLPWPAPAMQPNSIPPAVPPLQFHQQQQQHQHHHHQQRPHQQHQKQLCQQGNDYQHLYQPQQQLAPHQVTFSTHNNVQFSHTASTSWPEQGVACHNNSAYTTDCTTTAAVGVGGAKYNANRVGVAAEFPCFKTASGDALNSVKKALTQPSTPALNNSQDNVHSDLILFENDLIFPDNTTEQNHVYIVREILGKGTFGQVAKCYHPFSKKHVAVKVIKNLPDYYKQSATEIKVLHSLNYVYDRTDSKHIVRCYGNFVHRNHRCLVFELLDINLFDVIKASDFKGLHISAIRNYVVQILQALVCMDEASVIHCDLKPENVLLTNKNTKTIKVIDFGSSCLQRTMPFMYIQSRFYRAPEILMGLPYTNAIDIWSLGCIAVELFLGLPVFPGSSVFSQITRIVETIGVPPTSMIEHGRNSSRYFAKEPEIGTWIKNGASAKISGYRLKTILEYNQEYNENEKPNEKYFEGKRIPEIIRIAGEKRHPECSEADIADFISFVSQLLTMNPMLRPSAKNALLHPFLRRPAITVPQNIYGNPSLIPLTAPPNFAACGVQVGSSATAFLPPVGHQSNRLPGVHVNTQHRSRKSSHNFEPCTSIIPLSESTAESACTMHFPHSVISSFTDTLDSNQHKLHHQHQHLHTRQQQYPLPFPPFPNQRLQRTQQPQQQQQHHHHQQLQLQQLQQLQLHHRHLNHQQQYTTGPGDQHVGIGIAMPGYENTGIAGSGVQPGMMAMEPQRVVAGRQRRKSYEPYEIQRPVETFGAWQRRPGSRRAYDNSNGKIKCTQQHPDYPKLRNPHEGLFDLLNLAEEGNTLLQQHQTHYNQLSHHQNFYQQEQNKDNGNGNVNVNVNNKGYGV